MFYIFICLQMCVFAYTECHCVFSYEYYRLILILLVRTLQYVKWRSASAGILSALAALGITLLLVMVALFTWNIRTPIITHSNPIYLFTVSAGLALLCATVFTYVGALGLNAQERRNAVLSFTKGSVACNVRLWLAGMGIVLVLAAMTAKTYRLFHILENTTLVQVRKFPPFMRMPRKVQSTFLLVIIDRHWQQRAYHVRKCPRRY